MNGYVIAALILAIFFCIGCIRIGGGASLGDEGLTAWVRLGPKKLVLYPMKPKPEKPPKKKPKPQKPPKPKKEKPPKPKTSLGSKLREGKLLADIFVPIALEAAKGFFYKLQIDVLELYIHVGAYDPADGAVLYGRANALAAAVWLPLNQAFRIREGRVRVDWDPLAEKLVCAGQLALSLRIGEILWIGLRFGVKALVGFLRYRRLKRKAV